MQKIEREEERENKVSYSKRNKKQYAFLNSDNLGNQVPDSELIESQVPTITSHKMIEEYLRYYMKRYE